MYLYSHYILLLLPICNNNHNNYNIHSLITFLCFSFFHISTIGNSLSFNSCSRTDMEFQAGKNRGNGKRMSIVVGPWGGNGGTSWDDGSYHGVREIKLVYGSCIDSIRVVYDKNGRPVSAEQHGGIGGNRTAEIKLQYPEEIITSVSGSYCPVVYGGSPVIRSLAFKSNRKTFGPYGVEEGTPFTFPVDGGVIVGFQGRGGWYLDSIGFRLSRIQTPKLFHRVQKSLQRLTTVASSKPKDDENINASSKP